MTSAPQRGSAPAEQVAETTVPRIQPASARRGISARSILLGCLLVPANAFWIIRLERVMYGPYKSTISLFANVVFLLFILIGLNRVLQRWAPARAFSQAELL